MRLTFLERTCWPQQQDKINRFCVDISLPFIYNHQIIYAYTDLNDSVFIIHQSHRQGWHFNVWKDISNELLQNSESTFILILNPIGIYIDGPGVDHVYAVADWTIKLLKICFQKVRNNCHFFNFLTFIYKLSICFHESFWISGPILKS